MAVERAGAIELLEQSVQAIREAPLKTLLCHWTGSFPFALGLLFFFNDMTSFRATGLRCALESAALALLLVWMNCWRAVFADRIATQLGAAEPATLPSIGRLVLMQAFLSGTKLVAIPLAVLATIPLPWTVAFYRTCSCRISFSLSPMAKARKLAGLDQKQNAVAILILFFLYLVLLVNIAFLLAFLPELVRTLTGYESVFSRSGILFVINITFWLTAAVLSWLALDPLVQAVYCVRCFVGESLETGEDLRGALRKVSKAAAALAVILFCTVFAPSAAKAEISPQELERSIRQTMQSSRYDWRLAPAPSKSGASWFVTLTDRLVDKARVLLRKIFDLLERFLRWLRRWLTPQRGNDLPLPGAGLHWSVYLLSAVLAGLAGWLIWRMRRNRAARDAADAAATAAVVRIEDNLTADQLPEEGWFRLAEQFLRENNFRFALRALYLANLAWLGERQWIGIHPGKTNREYELELRRKARGFPKACGIFSVNVASFERAWYGMHEVSLEDAERFRAHLDEMKTVMA